MIKLGKVLGLNLVTGKCILMYAQPVRGFHGILLKRQQASDCQNSLFYCNNLPCVAYCMHGI